MLDSGTVVAADGVVIEVEPGSALLNPRILEKTGKRIIDCETARKELEAESCDSSLGSVLVVVASVIAAGAVGYLVGQSSAGK